MRTPFNHIAPIYEKTRPSPSQAMNRIVELLSHILGGYEAILDAGVGTGRFAKPLKEMGYFMVGVDISLEMLRLASKRQAANLLQADVRWLPFRNDSFDVTMSNHVIHEFPEWQVALREYCRVTRYKIVSVVHRPVNRMGVNMSPRQRPMVTHQRPRGGCSNLTSGASTRSS